MKRFRLPRHCAPICAIVALLFAIGGTASAQTQTSTTQYSYDLIGNRTQVVDPLGRVSDTKYDALSRPYQVIQPAPVVGIARPIITTTYDGLDQPATVTDPRKLVTIYTIDGLGNQQKLTSPDTRSTSATFDAAGNLKTSTDARGEITTYTYDALNRVTNVAYSNGPATSFEYDGGTSGVANAKGHLTKITDESGTTTYGYSRSGRLLVKTQMVVAGLNTAVLSVTYTYGSSGSATGKLTSMTYPSGNQVNYRYDEAGRVTMITVNPVNANGSGTNTSQEYALLTNLEYAAHGPVKGWKWGNSTSASPNGYSRSFDLDGRIVSYNLGNPASNGSTRMLTWDAASRIKAYTHVGSVAGIDAGVLDQGFDYDGLDRLKSFTGNGTTQAYTYDANGNRTTSSFGATAYTNTISATSNRLDATSGPVPAKSNQYDLAGNLLSDGTITYTYSARGRMSSAKVGTVTTAYLYNGLGQRVRQVSGTTANPTGLLVYDEAGHIIGEYNSTTGKASKEFVYLGDMPVGVLEQVVTTVASNQAYATNLYYVYVDHLNTPRVITRSPDGKIVWRWDSGDPFGLLPPNENPAGEGVFTFNLRMPGQYFDKSTNLFYNYFRDYDPQTGRYVQSDPIGLNGGINTYAYVGGAPVSYVDQMGLQTTMPGIPGAPPVPPQALPGTPENAQLVRATWQAWLATKDWLNSLKEKRPSGMTAIEERQYDRYCSNSNDPCKALKDAVRKAIGAAGPKIDNLLRDEKGMFGGPGWWTHIEDLKGRMNNINAMISLGQKMGCDMSQEIALAGGLYIPQGPR